MIKPNSPAFQKFLDDNSNVCFTSDFVDPFERYGKIAWEACKEEVLKILKEDYAGLDLSINSCDEYYIEKIEKL